MANDHNNPETRAVLAGLSELIAEGMAMNMQPISLILWLTIEKGVDPVALAALLAGCLVMSVGWPEGFLTSVQEGITRTMDVGRINPKENQS